MILVDPLVRCQLGAAYRHYTSTVSPPNRAISLELASFLWALMQDRQPERILDLGSGFSSWVFRRYAQTAAAGTTVCTVDHDPVWLGRTRAFLQMYDLSLENISPWDGFSEREFDLILNDFGSVEDHAPIAARARILDRVFSLVGQGGIIVLDDLQFPQYRARAVETVKRFGFRFRDLSSLTLDSIDRYSGLAIGP